jgi:hypothetical protein
MGLEKPVEMVPLYPPDRKVGSDVDHVEPPSVENSSTPPSKVFSEAILCQKERVADEEPPGIAMGLVSWRY